MSEGACSIKIKGLSFFLMRETARLAFVAIFIKNIWLSFFVLMNIYVIHELISGIDLMQ